MSWKAAWKAHALLLLAFPFSVCARADLSEDLLGAVRKGDAAAVKALLEKGADANAKYRYERTVLSFAADRGNMEVVKLLLEKGADPNSSDTFYKMTPLDSALSKGHTDIVIALLNADTKSGAGSKGGQAALRFAAGRGNLPIVRAVLAKGEIPKEALNAALAQAQRNKHAEVAELLEKAGAVPPPKADFQVDAATLATYAGVYKGDQGEVIVTLKDGKLMAAPTGQNALALGAINPTTFRPLEVDGIVVTFNVEEGKVIGITAKQGNNTMVFKKTEAKPQ